MMLTALLAASQIVLASPDSKTQISIAENGTSFTVSRDGEVIISPSALGLEFSDAPDLTGLKVVSVNKATKKQVIKLVATKSSQAVDWYNGATINFKEGVGSGRTLSIEARAYNDGVAFRYVLPKDTSVSLKDEVTTFNLSNDPSCEVTEYTSSHERPWETLKVSALDSKKSYDVAAFCASASGRTHFAIVQSGIESYAGARLAPVSGGMRLHLTPHTDNKTVAVSSASGIKSAWRVVMTADRAGDLIASPLIGNLAPQAQGDFGWVKPGKVAWDWWSGPTDGEKPSMERYKRFIDFAAKSGFPYFLIDAGWAFQSTPCCAADEKTDITRAEPVIDMPGLVKYAEGKGVGLLLWAHWKHMQPRMDEILDTYQKWGIKGVKVDFMERDDQEMVDFYVHMAQATAKRHMLLDMHGAFLPAGLSRTYPNYITQEGVMGAEYDKFAWGQVTPTHNVKLAYTRMLLGPMDYTPGGFRNTGPDAYKVREVMPFTRGTRGQALAQYVVYDSPLQMVSDDPDAYVNAEGFDFLKVVPTSWDETRFIGGTPDSYVTLARRKGKVWYVGAMSNEQARDVNIPLSFLTSGSYTATIWQDGSSTNSVNRTETAVTRDKTLTLKLASGGGGVIMLAPAK